MNAQLTDILGLGCQSVLQITILRSLLLHENMFVPPGLGNHMSLLACNLKAAGTSMYSESRRKKGLEKKGTGF